jgi:hypothetical protein
MQQSKLNIVKENDKLKMLYHWRDAKSFEGIWTSGLLMLIMGSFAGFIAISLLNKGGNIFIFMLAIASFSISLLALFFFYLNLSSYFNKTKILAEGELLYITHGPIPLFSARRILKSNLSKISIKPSLGHSVELSYVDNYEKTRPLFAYINILGLSRPQIQEADAQEIVQHLQVYFGLTNKTLFNENESVKISITDNNEVKAKKIDPSEENNLTKAIDKKNQNNEQQFTLLDNVDQGHSAIPAVPYTLRVIKNQDGFFIEKSWKDIGQALATLLGYVIFLIFPVLGLIAGIEGLIKGGSIGSSIGLISLFLPITVALGYYISIELARIFNKTTMYINDEYFSIRHSPIPIRKNFKISVYEINALEWGWENRYLHCIKKDNTKPFYIGIHSAPSYTQEELIYIKSAINSYLDNIKEDRMPKK